ncbi:MAG: potassium channel family protein [Clostridiales bacterium]|nr:potassium channel family protein [Clostridiales bacterium]
MYWAAKSLTTMGYGYTYPTTDLWDCDCGASVVHHYGGIYERNRLRAQEGGRKNEK